MKFKYSIPLLVGCALLVGEAGSHVDALLNWMPANLNRTLRSMKQHIKAPPFTLQEVITAVAKKHHVKEAFVKSIIKAESGFNPAAVSNKGAIGLMQLMPDTARDFGANPAVPEQNIDAGTHYLSWLLKRYKNHRDSMVWAIAAYNAGPGWVDKYKGIPPFKETKGYVTRVLKYYREYGGEAVMVADAKKSTRSRRAVHRKYEAEEAD